MSPLNEGAAWPQGDAMDEVGVSMGFDGDRTITEREYRPTFMQI